MEVGGRNYRKLEVSLESMEASTSSMEAPTTSMEGSINLHEKNILVKKIISRFVKLAKLYIRRHGGGVPQQSEI